MDIKKLRNADCGMRRLQIVHCGMWNEKIRNPKWIQPAIKNKRVLITAGPTWVAIDKVRVISNIATGQTGIYLTKELAGRGVKVTLLLGSGGLSGEIPASAENIRVLRFRYFEELRALLRKQLKNNFEIIIHSAAVSDYQPIKPYKGKISSDGSFALRLNPTPKLAALIRKFSPGSFFVVFKLEVDVAEKILLARAGKMREKLDADLVVANTLDKDKYRAFILDREGEILARVRSKRDMVKRLVDIIVPKSAIK